MYSGTCPRDTSVKFLILERVDAPSAFHAHQVVDLLIHREQTSQQAQVHASALVPWIILGHMSFSFSPCWGLQSTLCRKQVVADWPVRVRQTQLCRNLSPLGLSGLKPEPRFLTKDFAITASI